MGIRFLIFLALSFGASLALADFPSAAQNPDTRNHPELTQYHGDYCSNVRKLNQFKPLAYDPKNLMAFANGGGILNLGTCWWHSRLQRAAIYLTRYFPKRAKPTSDEAERLIAHLTTLRSVVEIPGYKNFREFSAAWEDVIQRKLNQWQRYEGILGFTWIDGLMGEPTLPTSKLNREVEKIWADTQVLGRISFAKLQLPGIESHALLVVDAEKTEVGYLLRVIDSNYPDFPLPVAYTHGDQTFYGGVPYLERTQDFTRIASAQRTYCSKMALGHVGTSARGFATKSVGADAGPSNIQPNETPSIESLDELIFKDLVDERLR